MQEKENKSNNYWSLILILIICIILMDTNKLKNTPDYIYLIAFVIVFPLANIAWFYYLKGTKWYLKIKSILLYLLALAISSTPIIFGLVILFNIFISNYEFENEKIITEKCLVTHVSSGKNSSLEYLYKGRTFQTKNYYYQDFKGCSYNKDECYILLTLKTKPLGMFYEVDIEKYTEPVPKQKSISPITDNS